MSTTFQDFLFVKRKGVHQKIAIKDITVLEANRDYIIGYLDNGEQFVVRISMNKLVSMLPASDFMRVHRSYLIQLSKIEAINFVESTVEIGKRCVPVNKECRKLLNDMVIKLE